MTSENCVFCRIAAHKEEKTVIMYEDEEFVVFPDIRPAATHHYLVIPKHHIKDPKHLDDNHIELVEKLISTGQNVLGKNGGDLQDSRFGFHWPPFTSINHLHLHVISPCRELGWIARAIFSIRSFWFVTAEWLLDRLKEMKSRRAPDDQ